LSYLSERKTSGRRPLMVVEIDVDTCSNEYGVLPCSAVLPEPGFQCFNTFSTCQDRGNFNKSTKTLRFCEDVAGLPVDFGAIPSIKIQGVTLDPTIIDPAKTLGIRAKTTINFTDHPYTDNITDPYVIARQYDPLERGTFWGKFLARNPNYEGRNLRVIVGYLNDDGQFEAGPERLFLIDKIEGPDSAGNVRLIAKDILTLAENKKQKLPKASNGKLNGAINATQTTFSVDNGSQYDASGVIAINKELLNFTRSGNNFTVSRGQYGTPAAQQSDKSTVQQCLSYTDENVIDIVRDLLLRVDVDPSFIPFAEWTQEKIDWLEFNEYSRVISKPTGVSQLLNELCEQSLISIWWDERVQKVKLKSMSPPLDVASIPTITDDANFIEGSLKIDRLTDQRLTQVWLYSELENQISDNKKQENYERVDVVIDADSEALYGDVREKIILGTWLTDVTTAVKLDITTKTINKFKNSPIKATFSLDAKDSDIWTGSIIFVKTDRIQTTTGEPSTLIMLVTKAKEAVTGTRINYEASTAFDYAQRLGRWTDDDALPYLTAPESERLVNGYWTNDNGTNPDGSDGTTWI